MGHETAPGEPPGGRLRRLPLPVSQPPYDDELDASARPADPRRRLTDRGGPTQGALALSLSAVGDVSEPRPLRVVGDDAPSGSTALPDPRRWTAKLTQAAIEGIHGRRSIQQLVRWTDETVYKSLARRAAAQVATPVSRPRVRAIRACRVSDAVAEASVVVQLGPLVRAVAIRLEAVDDRWLCTAFEIVEKAPAARPGARGQPLPHSSSNAEA